MTKELTAYDYSAQRWVTGSDARPLIASQLQADIDLLSSERGDDFAAFLGLDRSTLLDLRRQELLALA